MAPPTYFFPRVLRDRLVSDDQLCREFLADLGLARTFDDVLSVSKQCSCMDILRDGPGGATGCMLTVLPASGKAPLHVGHFPERQTWKAVLGDRVWVGVDNEYPIEPEDIVRTTTRGGYMTELAGQQWLIPIIRDPLGGTALERDWEIDETGRLVETVAATEIDLWNSFAGVVELYYGDNGGPDIEISNQEAADRCVDALSVNYRFDRVEQNLLKLITPDTWSTILMAALDVINFPEAFLAAREKKTDPTAADSPPTAPGCEDCDPATDPVEAS